MARAMAAYGMARAKAELGEFGEAIRWLKQAPTEYWSGCGTCAERKEWLDYPALVVWTKAELPYRQALKETEAIVEGRFSPMKVQTIPQELAAKAQKRRAAAEAALILGELCLRHGQRNEARRYFERAASESEDDPARLAGAYLDGMSQFVDAYAPVPSAPIPLFRGPGSAETEETLLMKIRKGKLASVSDYPLNERRGNQ